MKTRSPRVKKSLTPLLLMLAINQACALEIIVIGEPGISGMPGLDPGQHGGNATAAPALDFEFAVSSYLLLTVYGGQGGRGGGGAGSDGLTFAGNGGNGGDGAATSSSASATGNSDLAWVHATVFGGYGGDGGASGGVGAPDEWEWPNTPYDPMFGQGGAAGNGGMATSTARATATGATNVSATAVAVGGNGGNSMGNGSRGGAGGAASATAYGRSDTGNVWASAEAVGGISGQGDPDRRGIGAAGVATTLVNAVSGQTTGDLTLEQRAVGGAGGTLTDDASWDAAPVGGDAAADLVLTSTRRGAALAGDIAAVGGLGGVSAGPFIGGGGGNATAFGLLTGTAAVTGNATATGGDGYVSVARGSGGNALSRLDLVAGDMATGTARATGGAGAGWSYFSQPSQGNAEAILTLVGAGAQGGADAAGRSAASNVTVTTGALGADVRAQALSSEGDASAVIVLNQTAQAAPAAGSAAVRAVASAESGRVSKSGGARASLDVTAYGAIDGISTARTGNAMDNAPWTDSSSGAASADARGVGRGDASVTLAATAVAGSVDTGVQWTAAGAPAQAQAYGQSGRGAVSVAATAQAGRGAYHDAADVHYGAATAVTRAVTTAYGGVAQAVSSARGGDISALAQADGVDAFGAPVRVSASTTGSSLTYNAARTGVVEIGGTALASSVSDRASTDLPALPALPADGQVVSHVAAASSAPSLADGDPGALGMVAGLGMQMMGSGAAAPGQVTWLGATGRFAFAAVGGEHLLVDLVSASVTNSFGLLEFTVTNNGVALFSQTLASADAAALFFTGHVLDLGILGSGMQDVVISSYYGATMAGALAFNYAVGASAISAVPEPSTWLMLVLGLGVMAAGARARRPV